MKKAFIAALSFLLILLTAGCGGRDEHSAESISGADGPASVSSEAAVSEGEADGPASVSSEAAVSEDESDEVTESITEEQEDIVSALSGTWHTISTGYEGDDGQLYPEHDVQFTDTEIQYGRSKDGTFVPDYADRIVLIQKDAEGRYIIQAEAANGVQYTYRMSEGNADALEYFGTWDESDFPNKYSGGASLYREE